jgi:lysozyme
MTDKAVKTQNPNASMKMSPEARARMRATEKAIYRYYNDMGKSKGNCSWVWAFSPIREFAQPTN